jgi:hypothetical protein
MDESQMDRLMASLDGALLDLIGPVPYIQAMASIVALEESVGASDNAAEALSLLCQLVALRYVKGKRNG